MIISFNWLKSFINMDLDVQRVAEILTDIGLEVEKIHEQTPDADYLNGVVVGRVEHLEPHPGADKLQIAKVDLGKEETVQIVCGASNIREGQKVAVATVGAKLKSPDGKEFKIKKAKLRGEESHGMICSEKELNLGDDESGIMVLSPEFQTGSSILQYFPQEADFTLEIGLTPNRADAMSHYGVARDLFAAMKARKLPVEFIEPKMPQFQELLNVPIEDKSKSKTKEPPPPAEPKITVEVVAEDKAPRYCGIYLDNVQVKPSPNWLKNKLRGIGLNPKNNVVDVTNYVMHHLGQPLHAFDADKLKGNKILVKTFDKPRNFTTLDDVSHVIQPEDLMICDAEEGHCIAGVFGGKESGVVESTRAIFLESAYFDPVSVRKTSKRLGISTDSSFRFERGIDPEFVKDALLFAAELIKELSGAEVHEPLIDIYPKPIKGAQVMLRYHKLDQIIGERIHRAKVEEICDLLDIEVVNNLNSSLELNVPAYRVDVQREADVIEEILRIHGYNSIKVSEKMAFTPSNMEGLERLNYENKVGESLNQHGFSEAINNSMLNPTVLEPFNFHEKELVTMLNPLSEELKTMRPTMLPALLQNVSFNFNRGAEAVRLFEFGHVYKRNSQGYAEENLLVLVQSGQQSPEHWLKGIEKANFYEFKGLVVNLLSVLLKDEIKEQVVNHEMYSQSLTLTVREKPVARLGMVDKKLCKAFDVESEVFSAEIFWNEVLHLTSKTNQYFKEIPKFPGSYRDLALLIDKDVPFASLKEFTLKKEISILTKVDLFDVYESDKLPENTKSYALRFHFLNPERTLIDQEIDAAMEQLINGFKEEFKAELRA